MRSRWRDEDAATNRQADSGDVPEEGKAVVGLLNRWLIQINAIG